MDRKDKGKNKETEQEDELEIDMESDESEEEFVSDDEEYEEEYEGGEREFVEDDELESDFGDMEDYDGEDVSTGYINLRLQFANALSQSEAEDSDEEEASDDEEEEPRRSGKGAPPSAGNKRKGPTAGGPKRSKCKAAQMPRMVLIGPLAEAPRVNVEYEVETEPLSKEMLANW